MPDIPYKQLMEGGEPFYPVTGPSSFNGQLPVSKGGTGAANAAQARANLGIVDGLGAALLWTNPNPTSTFAEQTISLDLSEYSFVIIEYGHDYGFVTGTAIFPVPTITPTQGFAAYNEIQGVKWTGSQCAIYMRSVKITTSSIWFGDGTRFTAYNTSQSTTTDNNVGFPKRIWGIK